MKAWLLMGAVGALAGLYPATANDICDVSAYEGPLPETVALLDKHFILIGEMHGTAQSPFTMAEIACRAAAGGKQVAVALEHPDDLSLAPFRAETLAQMAPEARETDLAYWLRPTERADGRTSKAMFSMIRTLMDWQANGLPISVHFVDKSGWEERDSHMAENIKALDATGSYDQIFFYAGNFHTRTLAPDAEGEPAVSKFLPPGSFSTFNLFTDGGEIWAAIDGKHGPHPMQPWPNRDKWKQGYIYPWPAGVNYAHDAFIKLEDLTASPPMTEADLPTLNNR